LPSNIGNKHSSLLQCKTNYSRKKFYSTGLAKEPCLQTLEINTLAYYNANLITAAKSFIAQGELKSFAFKYWK
jgi:hypothetical protein